MRTRAPRPLLAFAGILVLLGLFLALASLWDVVSPHEDEPEQADAIVVFGGTDDRLALALQLASAGLSSEVVFNIGIDDASGRPHATPSACEDDDLDFVVRCIIVAGDSTRTEAREFASIAREEGWSNLIALTSRSHLTRASRALGLCFDGAIQPAASEGPGGIRVVGRATITLAAARVIHRSC